MTPGLCSVLLNEAELPVFEARPKFISLYQEGEVSSELSGLCQTQYKTHPLISSVALDELWWANMTVAVLNNKHLDEYAMCM